MSNKDTKKHETRKAAEPADAERESAQPDVEGVGEAVGEALEPPDFRTKTSSPSTSERRLRPDELPDPKTSTQG
jgi:hypothetical protein